MDNNGRILVINAGSSSLKFAVFNAGLRLTKVLEGAIEKIGSAEARLVIKDKSSGADDLVQNVAAQDHSAAANLLVRRLEERLLGQSLSVISHRLVHGGPKYNTPVLINNEVLADLKSYILFDPEHLPTQIQLVETFRTIFPDMRQTASFDTTFHRDLPARARLLPIPRRYQANGLRRFGFHGLSCTYIMGELARITGPEAANGRVIIAHLGNGVSLTAVEGGKSIDTTMGLTPASGVPMSNRSGDLDPGLALYLSETEGLDAKNFSQMASFESGLLGISETSSDMERLLSIEAADPRAAEAVELFCYQVKKAVGSLAAALGGLDTLVFTGGMGEVAPAIRERVCKGLEFLGIEIDQDRNKQNTEVISTDGAKAVVRIIHTDEASVAASEAWRLINQGRMDETKA